MNFTYAFPLQWPQGVKRSNYARHSPFTQSMATAEKFLSAEIGRMGGKEAVVSCNLEFRADGIPKVRQTASDKGVALYFTRKGKRLSFACDKYYEMQDNLYAIGKTLEAMRGIERWGTSEMMDQAFTGFAALPEPRKWFDILGVNPTAPLELIQTRYRDLAKRYHPDVGGSHDLMADLNWAYDAAKAQVEAK